MGYNSNVKIKSFNGPLDVRKKMVGSTAHPKTLFAFGINHRTAPVEIREKLYLREEEIVAFLDLLKGSLTECVVLSTCNRTEIYGVSDAREIKLDDLKNLLIDFKDARGLVRDEHFFALISCTASRQILNVATSIDSRVIGDSQILRQLRAAYDIARQNGFAGKILNQLLQRAFRLGKTTYTETSIHDGAVSVSLAAVELGLEIFGSLQERTALIIGAGEMARSTVEALANKRLGRILVTNRTRVRAEELIASLPNNIAAEFEILDFENFKDCLTEVDVIVSSTGSNDTILYAADFARVERRTLVLDIAVPRDVDNAVRDVPNVILKNIDDLRSIIDGHHEKRIKDLPKVKKMIVEEMVDFLTWYYSLPIMPEYEKTGAKPSAAQVAEILKVKRFLNENLNEIHRIAARSGGDFYEDLNDHFSLIKRLQTLKAEAFATASI